MHVKFIFYRLVMNVYMSWTCWPQCVWKVHDGNTVY